MADEDRTEAATPKRRDRARESGSIPMSREVAAVAGLAAASVLFAMAGPRAAASLVARLAHLLDPAAATDPATALWQAMLAAAALVAPVALGITAASVAASLLQTQFLFRPAALLPDLTRLNPARGLKRVFGLGNLAEAGKSLVKLAVLGYAAWHVLSGNWTAVASAPFWHADQLASRMAGEVWQLLLTILAAQTVIAGADVLWVRHRHAAELRMSREEVKQESKESDGNPQIKQRIRQIRMVRSRKRMLAAVPKATVVVTNPTHYAIALSYDRMKGGAPRVVAKGVDEVAASTLR